MPPAGPDTELSDAEIHQFSQDGFLFFDGYLNDDDEVEQLRNEADRIAELVVNSSLANDRKSHRLMFNRDGDGTQFIRTVCPINDLSRAFREMAVERFVPLLRPLLDDEPVSLDPFSQINYKQPLSDPIEAFDPPNAGGYEPHADWPYLDGKVPIGDDFVVQSVLFLDDCTEDNGPLEIWPGTHTQAFPHETKSHGGVSIPSDHLDPDAGQKLLGSAGSLLLFDSRLVHGSEPNRSGGPRRLVVNRHAPADDVETETQDGAARPPTEGTEDAGLGYPLELVEASYENEYRRQKSHGEFADRFSAPDT